jgi:hypothetical protein
VGQSQSVKVLSEYCDLCKTVTRRCAYYQKGRSRQHGKCLTCDSRDPARAEGYNSRDHRLCYECQQARGVEKHGP